MLRRAWHWLFCPVCIGFRRALDDVRIARLAEEPCWCEDSDLTFGQMEM